MTTTFELSYNELRGLTAIAKLAAGDVRYYLVGICFDPATRAAIVTNGHVLAWRGDVTVTGDTDSGQVIIPLPELKTITTGGNKADRVIVTYEPGECPAVDATFTLERYGKTRLTVSGRPIDGKYPEYQRVIPDRCSGETAHYDGHYVAALDKALRLMADTKNPPVLLQNGDSAAVICSDNPNIAAVIMPMRPGNAEYIKPTGAAARLAAVA